MPDGSYRFVATCRTDYAYMDGLLNDALIRYHDTFDPDPRIPGAVKRSLDFLWSAQWISSAGAFRYADGVCPGKAGPTPAPDLNLLIVDGFGWYYARSGDLRYLERGDAAFRSGVTRAFLQGDKQFNQNYSTSYRYLATRRRIR